MPRLPLINIGTYCRIKALDVVIQKFLQKPGQKQIISLGAGSDTRPFHLLPGNPELHYYELDFPVKTRAKARLIAKDPELYNAVGCPRQVSDNEMRSERYHLVPQDLRSLKSLDAPSATPTLILSECCLCYLSPEDSHNVLQYFVDNFKSLSLCLYEPIGLDDEFGRVMMENLAQRGLSLPTFKKFNTLEAQKMRLKDLGLEADALNIQQVYETWLTPDDRQRIASLEFLDEVEEMHLLLKHYSVVWGSKD